MARKAAKKAADTDDDAPKESSASKKLIERVRKRYDVMLEADRDNRDKAMEDFKFVNVPGYQWDDEMKKFRGDRPCYEFNELRQKCKRIINDMRANRPAAKVRGYEDSDKQTAEIYEGLCRNIWNRSDADTIVDNAGEYQVAAGMACWRVVTDYEDPESFDQDIYIEGIKNPFCLLCDPAAKDPMKRDAEDWILTERIAKSAYETKWPGKEVIDFEGSDLDDEDWGCEDDKAETVRICEYWYKEPVEREIWLLDDGKVIRADSEAAKAIIANKQEERVKRRRVVKSHNIMMAIVSGNAVLTPPQVCAGRGHRFVMVYGEYIVIDGKAVWFGLPRFSKDAQRNLNLTITNGLEQTAMSLQSKHWATPKQAEGMLASWREAIQKNIPFAIYNHDPQEPGAPERIGGPEVPVAAMQLAIQAEQLLNATTGIHEESQGENSNAKSGRAILAKEQQGAIATFNFQDNMAKGVLRTHEILLDLIPEIIDTERTIRILGADGAEDYVTVNKFVENPDDPQNPIKENDLNEGRYDVTVTVGPNFATRRQEASEVWREMAQADPLLMQTAPDLVYKSMDVPYSEDIAERRRAMLPPQIQQMLQKDKQLPPEVMAAKAELEQQGQLVQQHAQLVQAAAGEVKEEQAKAEKAKSDVTVAQARFDADMANRSAALTQQEAQLIKQGADLAIREATLQSQQQQGALAEEGVTQAHASIAEMQQAVAEVVGLMANHVQQLEQNNGMAILMPKRARPKGFSMTRVNGQPVVSVEYDGQPDEHQMARVRGVRGPNGEMIGVPEFAQPGPATTQPGAAQR
jgi:hypothetical protein